jgi:hypothetical protein
MVERLHLDEEGLYGQLRVIVGLEIGNLSHHYLAYNIRKMVRAGNYGPQDIINKVNEQGGFGFLAHPFEKGMPLWDKSLAYTWDDLMVTGFTGICIWNFSSRWKERIKTVLHGLFFLLFKSQLLKGPSRKTLKFWDNACRTRRVVAIGGSDAHGAVFKWGVLRFTPLTYYFLLNSINIHILLKHKLPANFTEAKTAIYSAMKEGRLFIALDAMKPSKGFRYHFVSEDGAKMLMGEEKKFQPGNIYIETPVESEIRLVRNGLFKEKWRGKKALCQINQPGVYRVEVYCRVPVFGWRPWIFSNPIYLR